MRPPRVRDLGTFLVYEGVRHVHWDGADDHGRPVASGNYRILVRVDRQTFERSVVLTK